MLFILPDSGWHLPPGDGTILNARGFMSAVHQGLRTWCKPRLSAIVIPSSHTEEVPPHECTLELEGKI